MALSLDDYLEQMFSLKNSLDEMMQNALSTEDEYMEEAVESIKADLQQLINDAQEILDDLEDA